MCTPHLFFFSFLSLFFFSPFFLFMLAAALDAFSIFFFPLIIGDWLYVLVLLGVLSAPAWTHKERPTS